MRPSLISRGAAIAVAVLFGLSSLAHAQLIATPGEGAPPTEVSAPIKALIGPATKVVAGPATLEFWWVSALPADGAGAFEWSRVAEGSLVGVLRVAGPFKEIRGKPIKPGVYTLRLGLQPQNGDHLGASPFREYLLLSPAAADTDVKPLGFDGTVALSKQTIGASHPAALSLDPPVATTGAPLSVVSNELGHKGVIVELKTTAGATLRFGLTLIGLIEH